MTVSGSTARLTGSCWPSIWLYVIFGFPLEVREFISHVDHEPLTFAMAPAVKPWSARQQHHLSAISEFTTDIQHEAGKDNPVADRLSWARVSSVHLGIDYTTMAADRLPDGDIQAFRRGYVWRM